MRSRNLGPLFAAILTATAASACGGSIGSVPNDSPPNENPTGNPPGTGQTDPTEPTTPTTPSVPYENPFACDPIASAFEAVRIAIGVDYLELRNGLGERRAEVAAGTPCSGAAPGDADACKEAFDAATSDSSLYPIGMDGRARILVTTKGSEVAVIDSREKLLAALGTIDAPAKAWLVAQTLGYQATCDTGWVASAQGGWVLRTVFLVSDCPMQYADVALLVQPDGSVKELERKLRAETGGCAGRRPEGLVPALPSSAASEVGRHLAMLAHLEAASVHAFRVVREELIHHGAPSALVAAASRALRDEVRHAAMMKRLAHRYGAEVSPARVEERPLRSLEAMALENAREGCVRELYGALEATWQAEAAEDEAIARAMRRIARDETRHAELSLAIAEWLSDRLDEDANARVAAAEREAFAELEGELAARRSAALTTLAGLPSAEQSCVLVRRLELALAA